MLRQGGGRGGGEGERREGGDSNLRGCEELISPRRIIEVYFNKWTAGPIGWEKRTQNTIIIPKSSVRDNEKAFFPKKSIFWICKWVQSSQRGLLALTAWIENKACVVNNGTGLKFKQWGSKKEADEDILSFRMMVSCLADLGKYNYKSENFPFKAHFTNGILCSVLRGLLLFSFCWSSPTESMRTLALFCVMDALSAGSSATEGLELLVSEVSRSFASGCSGGAEVVDHGVRTRRRKDNVQCSLTAAGSATR